MRQRRYDDSGQMMTALVIGLCMTLLAFLVVALVPVGAATNEKTRSQTAADAAALAAAERMRTLWVDVNTQPLGLFHPEGGNPGRPLTVGLVEAGNNAAISFASRNDARVLPGSPRVSLGRGHVEVDVENTYSALEDTRYSAAGRSRSHAEAQMDVDFEGCEWSPRPAGLPTLESTPPGPLTFRATLACGEWNVEYEFSNSLVAQFPAVRRLGSRDDSDGTDGWYESLEPFLVD